MNVTIGHLHYNERGKTIYVRVVDPTPLKRAMVDGAVRRALGLSLMDEPRPQPESMLFSTVGYEGEGRLEDLDVELFNRLIEESRPLKDIKKGAGLEVQAAVSWLVPKDHCDLLAGSLGNGVTGARVHPYLLPWVLSLTVLGMDDGPNTELVQRIGVDLCNKLADWAVEP